jgi:hypothetical protein
VLEVDRAYNPGSSPWWQSTAICGFVASFVVYVTLARLVRKRLTAPVTITTSDGRGVL